MRTERTHVYGFDGAAHRQSAEEAIDRLKELQRYEQSEPRFSFLGRLQLICVCHFISKSFVSSYGNCCIVVGNWVW